MKAIIKFVFEGKTKKKTVHVIENDPNLAVRQFIKETKLPKTTEIKTIKCGIYEYQWYGPAVDAFDD